MANLVKIAYQQESIGDITAAVALATEIEVEINKLRESFKVTVGALSDKTKELRAELTQVDYTTMHPLVDFIVMRHEPALWEQLFNRFDFLENQIAMNVGKLMLIHIKNLKFPLGDNFSRELYFAKITAKDIEIDDAGKRLGFPVARYTYCYLSSQNQNCIELAASSMEIKSGITLQDLTDARYLSNDKEGFESLFPTEASTEIIFGEEAITNELKNIAWLKEEYRTALLEQL